MRIDQNVEIWGQNIKSIKMLQFVWKSINRLKCWNLSAKCQIWSKRYESIKKLKFDRKGRNLYNIEIWVQNVKLIKILQFVYNVWNQSKCWNLSAKRQIDQNVEIWVQKINQNAAVCVKNYELLKMLKFKDKIGTPIKCWNFSANVKSIKMLRFECKRMKQ